MVGLKEKINNRIHELKQNIVSLREEQNYPITWKREEEIETLLYQHYSCITELKQVLEWIN